MDGSVSKVNDELSLKLEPQEVDSLVQLARRTEGAEEHHLCFHLRQFDVLESEVQFTTIWKSVGFMRPVSVGMHCRTIHDFDDGFGDRTAACREHTLLGDDPNSEIILWIKGHAQVLKSGPSVI